MLLPSWISLVVLCLSCLVEESAAAKETYRKTSSDMFSHLVVSDFGMAVGGKVVIDYNSYPQDESKEFPSYVLALVLSRDQKNGWYGDITQKNLPDSTITQMCQQPSMLRQRLVGSGEITFDITASIGEDRYSVAVLQCFNGNQDNPVTVDLTVNCLNPRPDSTEYSHLPIEKVMIVRVLEGELIIYALLIAGMLGQILTTPRYARPIHWLFLATLVAIFISCAVRYGGGYRYNKLGTKSDMMTIAENVFATFATTLLLSSLLLLSIGWTLIRSNMIEKEIQLMAIFIGAYLVFALAGDTCLGDSAQCVALNLIPFILQSLILLAVIIAMNFSVTQLRAMVSNSPWVPSTPLQYARMKQYHVFRLMFLLYLLLPTAFLIYEVVVLTWREQWISFTLSELLDIAMIFHVGVTFSPLNDVLMIRAFDGSGGAGQAVAAAGAGGDGGGVGGVGGGVGGVPAGAGQPAVPPELEHIQLQQHTVHI